MNRLWWNFIPANLAVLPEWEAPCNYMGRPASGN